VPRANQLAVGDHALSKRAAAMQADVVHRGDSAIHICDADFFFAALEFLGIIFGGEFGLGG